MNYNEIIITDHAYSKAKERLKFKKSTLDKMANKAFLSGIEHKDTKGLLKKFISKKWCMYKICNNVRIYGENIYFFSNNKLITLYRLESKLLKYLSYSKNENTNKRQ